MNTQKLSPGALRKRRRQRRGVAIVLVLSAITILTVMLAEFQDETSAEFGAALSQRDGLKAEYAARSAVNLSRLLIAAEPTIRQELAVLFLAMGGPIQLPVWEFADSVLGAFNDESGGEAFSGLAGVNLAEGKNLGIEGAGFEVKIVDEDSKININAGARGGLIGQIRLGNQIMGLIGQAQYNPMFEQRDKEGQFSDRSAVCSAIIDWADPDLETAVCAPDGQAQQNAAEDSYYQLLKKPYPRKNAAYDSLEELHLVRGVSDDFWATFVEPDPDKPDRRVFTVYGSEKVNVNTANPQTVLALVCAAAVEGTPVCNNPAEAAKILGAMEIAKSISMGAPPFKSAKAFAKFVQGQGQLFTLAQAALQLEPVQLKRESELLDAISVESKIFSIYATGYVKAGKRETRVRIQAVVDFRNAPPPGLPKSVVDGLAGLNGGNNPLDTNSATGGTGGTGGSGADLPAGATDAAIASAFAPNPGGNILYYRVE